MTGNAHLNLKLSQNNRCRCSGCGEYFNSVGAFDKHRNGTGEARHCWTVEQMTAKGMVMNAANYWCSSASTFDWLDREVSA